MKYERNITVKVIKDDKVNIRMLARCFARKYEKEIKNVKKRIVN